MAKGPHRGSALRFSTEDLPERDRLAVYREVHGRQLMRVDLEPLPDRPFRVDVTLLGLPGLSIMSSQTSGGRVSRTRELIADGDDDVFFGVTLAGGTQIAQRGHELVVQQGGAVLTSNADVGTIYHPGHARFVGLKMRRTSLLPLVTDLDDALLRPVPRESPALKLLIGYLELLAEQDALATPDLRNAAIVHVQDLVALALGATRDAAAFAEGRGLKVARLRAIKHDIAAHLGDATLTPGAVARRLDISESYVRKLFHAEGTSFTDFVLVQRLGRAHRALSDPSRISQNVAAIAYEVGFGDLSHFNRAFRRFYGKTPSHVREEAEPFDRSKNGISAEP